MKPDPRMAMMGIDPVDHQIAQAEQRIGQLAKAQDDELSAKAPQGNFSKAALGRFAKALNGALEAFGSEPVQAPAEDSQVFPQDLAAGFLMVCQAVNDAIQEHVLEPELAIDPGQVADDKGLSMAGARLLMVAKSKDFRRWLKGDEQKDAKSVSQPKPQPGEAQAQEPSQQDVDSILSGRM